MHPLPRGIIRTPHGWRTSLTIRGHRHRHHWPADTPLETMRAWLAATRARAVLGLEETRHRPPPTLAQDVTAYLERVRTLPTYTERARDLALWVEALGGDRPRASITASDIRAVRERWLTVGPLMRQAHSPDGTWGWQVTEGPLAASTVNHRLRALANVWTVLDGPHAPCPVREVPEAREPDPEPRAVDYTTIRALLAALEPGRTRARLRLMAYTGLPPATIATIRPEHIDWKAKTLWVRGRQKGRGTGARVIPLVPEAVTALRELAALKAWGPYSTSSARWTLLRACRRLGVPTMRPYDLRHSWLTLVAAASGDERAVQELAGHQDIRTTRRYTLASVAQRLTLALRAAQAASRTLRRPTGPESTGRAKIRAKLGESVRNQA